MEGASSTLSAAQLAPQAPFDPYQRHFDISSRHETANHHPPEGWRSGDNDSHPHLGQPSNQHDMDGPRKSLDMATHGIQGGVGSSSLSAHRPKKKRFICGHCMRTFARSGHLQRHERSHTNERPFQCPQCSSTFGRLDTLLRHERTLHGLSTSGASNNPAHRRSASMHSSAKPILNRSNSTGQSTHAIQPLDPQLARFRQSPTMTHHNIDPSPPTIPSFSPIRHDPQSPSLISNGPNFSPPWNLLPNSSPSMVNSTLVHPAPHTPHFSPLAESSAPWDSFPVLEAMPPSASFGDIQSQFSRLLFSLLPRRPSVSPTLGSIAQTPTPLTATPNFDSFIHSPSPMSFPLSSERGLIIPTHAPPISSPINTSASYSPGSKTSFLRSLENFDRGVLESYIAECDMDVSLADFALPKNDALNRYLCAYFGGMHQHNPFIHTPTFNPVSIKPPLLLSMCCIGALYCFDRDTSRKLHIAARQLIHSYLENKSSKETSETWVLQTLLLTMIYAAYSGNINFFERGLVLQGVLGNLLRNQAERVRIKEESLRQSPMSWEQWIAIEGFKRTYYSVYCFFTQLCMTFEIPSNITNAEPRLSLPCSEAEWRAADPETWFVLHNSPSAPPTPSYTNALRDLFTPTDDPNPNIRYSHFGSFIMINAICSQLWAHLKLRIAEPEIKLTSIQYAIDQWQRAWSADPDCSMSPASPHGPMSFNASALYRMANGRLFRDYSRVKASFRFFDVNRIIPVMAEDVSGSGWVRNDDMMRAIMPAILQLQIPIKMGIKVVARTAALIWSVEHALCAMESALLLCDWLRSIENEPTGTVLTKNEQKVLDLVKQLLTDAGIPVGDGERLSAATLNIWAGTFDNVWVWGLTPLLAKVLRQFAEEIQKTAHVGRGNSRMCSMSRTNPPSVVSYSAL